MICRRGAYHHFYAGGELLACGSLETGAYTAPVARPYSGTRTRHSSTPFRIFLQQLHVAVTATHTDIAQLGHHPHILCGRHIEQTGYTLVQLQQSKSGSVHSGITYSLREPYAFHSSCTAAAS